MDEIGPGQTGEPEEHHIRTGQVIGGAVLGFVATWLLFFVVVMSVYAQYGDSAGTTGDIVGGAGLLALPVVFGLLLIPRRTRYWGAGFLMGFAIGSISGAGVCGGIIGLSG